MVFKKDIGISMGSDRVALLSGKICFSIFFESKHVQNLISKNQLEHINTMRKVDS